MMMKKKSNGSLYVKYGMLCSFSGKIASSRGDCAANTGVYILRKR